jgi:hypothetical protein
MHRRAPVRAAARCAQAGPERAALRRQHCPRRCAPDRSDSQHVPRGLRRGRLASFRGDGCVRRERRPLGLHANGARDPSMRLLGSRHGASARSSASPTRPRRLSRRAATRASPRRAPSSRHRAATSARACRRRPPRTPLRHASLQPPRRRRTRLRRPAEPMARTAPPELRARLERGATQAVPQREAAPTRAENWMRAAPRVTAEDWEHLAAGAVRADRRRSRRRRPGFRDGRRELRTRPHRTGPDRRSQRPP